MVIVEETFDKNEYYKLVQERGICHALNKLKNEIGDEKACVFFSDNLEKTIPRAPIKTKRIATYFQQMGQGGTEKVVSLLLTIWNEMGYETYLLVDKKKTSIHT